MTFPLVFPNQTQTRETLRVGPQNGRRLSRRLVVGGGTEYVYTTENQHRGLIDPIMPNGVVWPTREDWRVFCAGNILCCMGGGTVTQLSPRLIFEEVNGPSFS